MIDSLALRIATGIKNTNPEKTASIEVMKYALIGLLNTLIISVLSLAFGMITGKFSETVLFSIAFIILRSLTGGFHFNSSVKCIVISTIIASGFPHLPVTFTIMNLFIIISLILILIYAPANIEGQTRIPPKFYPHLKVIAAFIVASNFLIGNPSLAVGFFVQSLTLVNFMKRR